MPSRQPPRFTLLGAGAVGTVLGPLLRDQGWKPIGVFGRTEESPRARNLARTLGADTTLPLDAACQASDVVLVLVPDDQIQLVAEELASTEVDWSGKTVLHVSGIQPAEVLAPLGTAGAVLAAAHPLQSFPERGPAPSLEGVYVTLQGDDEARRVAKGFFEGAGARTVTLSAEDKVAVHAAATILSNFSVTVAALAREVLQTTPLGEKEIVGMLHPLLQGTQENIANLGPDRALTGPIARGDRETVAGHVAYLARQTPHLMTVYVALATETVRLARKTARLSGSDAMDILDTVVAALPMRAPDDDQ